MNKEYDIKDTERCAKIILNIFNEEEVDRAVGMQASLLVFFNGALNDRIQGEVLSEILHVYLNEYVNRLKELEENNGSKTDGK